MKIKYFILMSFALAMTFAACDSDGDEAASSSNLNRNDTEQNLATGRLEFPKTRDDGNNIIVVHCTDEYGINYAVEWDCEKKAQRWTCYEMYASNSVENWARANWNGAYWQGTTWTGDPFQEDPDIPEEYRTTIADYRGSGYQRGHICPSADRLCSMEANGQTYYLSNIHPQHGAFNTGLWLDMENKVRSWNRNSFRDTLYVCKGGTIEDYGTTEGVKGYTSSGLIVPKYFFMALLCKRGSTYKALAFWVEHENIDRSDDDLSQYVISVRELEEKTGIDFFCNLPDDTEEYVETVSAENIVRAWGL